MADLVGVVRNGIGAVGATSVEAAEAAVIAAYPFLGLPIIKQIWQTIVEKYTSALITEFQDSSTRILIPIINDLNAKAAIEAGSKLRAALSEEQTRSEDLARDLADFKKKYAELIRMRIGGEP